MNGLTQSQIDRQLEKIKAWYIRNYPLCVFCGHHVRRDGELAHLVRRSYSIPLQPVKLNTGLAHHDCQEIYDDHPDQAVYLPRILEVLFITYLLDQSYFNLISGNFDALADVLQLFPDIVVRQMPNHHGEIITLHYLY